MNNNVKNLNPYSAEWFESRAFDSLKKIGEGVWDFSDSLLLYIQKGSKEYEEAQKEDTPYYKLVTKPESEYLANIATDIVKELPDEFEYIDLGPGTENKEQLIFDAVKNQNKKLKYIPVDIDKYFLKLAADNASKQGIPTSELHSSFEELPQKLRDSNIPRFISLGLTYSNYEPKDILVLLKAMMRKGDIAFIEAQIRDRVDIDALGRSYSKDIQRMATHKIRLLGLDPQNDISQYEMDDGIKIWSTLKKSNSKLESKGVVADDRLLVFQSLRPTKESFEESISSIFPSYTLFDNNSSFIGALLK